MEPLVRASLFARTLLRRGHGLIVTFGLAAFVVYGGAAGEVGPAQAVALAIWALLLASRVRRKIQVTGDAPTLLDVEIGALLSVALEAALMRFDGGLSGRFSPALYVLVALVAAFA
ncbi:MAG: sensor domain-containing diguanylate cyclase, partial [Polyangiaceae bacterium]